MLSELVAQLNGLPDARRGAGKRHPVGVVCWLLLSCQYLVVCGAIVPWVTLLRRIKRSYAGFST